MTSYLTIKEAVAYIRVSTEEQGETGIGLDAQRAAIQAHAKTAGIRIIEWFQDVASGRGEKNLNNRPGLNNALIVSKEFDVGVLVDRFDRLSRNAKTIDEIIRGRGINVISASEEHTTDPSVLAGRAARAELEGDLISKRTRLALSDLKASGVLLGNRTNLEEAQKLGAASNKRRSEEKAREIADAIHSNSWHDLSVPALASSLNGLGIHSSRGQPWTVAALRPPRKLALELIRIAEIKEYQRHPIYGRY